MPVSGDPVSLEGNLSGEVRQQGTAWRINQVVWQTREILFNLNGRVLKDGSFYFNSSAQGNPENILRPLLGDLTVKGLIYANAKIVKNIKGKVQIKADFTAPSCLIKGNSCSDLSGRLSWNSQSLNLDLEAAFDTPLARSTLRLGSKGGETNITLKNVPAAYMTNVLDISKDAPLAGVIANCALKINREFIRGRGELDAGPTQPLSQPFVAKGRIDFQRDKKLRQTTFSGQRLQFNGGQVSIEGKTNSRAKTSNIKIDAALENIGKPGGLLDLLSGYRSAALETEQRRRVAPSGAGQAPGPQADRQPVSRSAIFWPTSRSISSLQGTIRNTPLSQPGRIPDRGTRSSQPGRTENRRSQDHHPFPGT